MKTGNSNAPHSPASARPAARASSSHFHRAGGNRNGFPHLGGEPGCLHGMHAVLRAARWAMAHRWLPTIEQIRDRFQVSRATAFRYRAAFRDELGLEDRPHD